MHLPLLIFNGQQPAREDEEMSAGAESKMRQQFSSAAERAINDHINMELYAAYAYQAAARHFEHDDVGLYGFARFFSQQSGPRF